MMSLYVGQEVIVRTTFQRDSREYVPGSARGVIEEHHGDTLLVRFSGEWAAGSPEGCTLLVPTEHVVDGGFFCTRCLGRGWATAGKVVRLDTWPDFCEVCEGRGFVTRRRLAKLLRTDHKGLARLEGCRARSRTCVRLLEWLRLYFKDDPPVHSGLT
jgi:hypothetical protein